MAADALRRSVAAESPLAEFRRLLRLERFKLRRRPLPKILLAVLVGISFGMPWLFYLTLGGLGGDPIGVDSRQLLDRLVFPGVLDASVENALSFGLPLLVVLTATSFGGEFAWGTVRLLLARGAGRGGYVLSKLTAICLWWGVILTAGTLSALVAGTLIAAVDGAPGPGSVGAGAWVAMGGRLLLAWAASCAYAALTALFVVQLRSTAFGLALGLVSFFGEGIVGSALSGVNAPVFELLIRLGINHNLRSLLGTAEEHQNSAPVAVAALLVFGVTMVQGAIRLLRTHDVVAGGG